MRRARSGCCARDASGHAATAPPTSVINLRRCMCAPEQALCNLSKLPLSDQAASEKWYPIRRSLGLGIIGAHEFRRGLQWHLTLSVAHNSLPPEQASTVSTRGGSCPLSADTGDHCRDRGPERFEQLGF